MFLNHLRCIQPHSLLLFSLNAQNTTQCVCVYVCPHASRQIRTCCYQWRWRICRIDPFLSPPAEVTKAVKKLCSCRMWVGWDLRGCAGCCDWHVFNNAWWSGTRPVVDWGVGAHLNKKKRGTRGYDSVIGILRCASKGAGNSTACQNHIQDGQFYWFYFAVEIHLTGQQSALQCQSYFSDFNVFLLSTYLSYILQNRQNESLFYAEYLTQHLIWQHLLQASLAIELIHSSFCYIHHSAKQNTII